MRFYGDLGLSGAAALALLFFGPLIVFVVRRRWRMASARQAEVRRLALLAAQEAEEAEWEALAAYTAASAAAVFVASETVEKESLPRPECPVCFKPATARCSRCKAVRYCSGKCQIIHWRQGHKDECHPPPVNDYNSESNLSSLEGLQVEQSDLTEKSLENKEDPTRTELPTFPERLVASVSTYSPDGNNDGNEHVANSYVNVSRKESSFGSMPSLSISSHSTISHSNGYPDNSSFGKKQLPQHDGALGEYAADVTPTVLETEPGTARNANSNPPPPNELARSNSSANSKSWSSVIKKASLSTTEADESILSGTSCPIASSSLDHASSEHFADERQIASFQRIVNGIHPCMSPSTENSLHESALSRAKSRLQQNGTLSKDVASGSMANGTSSEMKSSRTSRFSVSADLLSANGGAHSGVSYKSSVTSDIPRGPMVSNYAPGSVANGVPSSEKRDKELSSSKRHYSSELMLFPYGLFIKLYNSKIELRPCGLINCGNSCYANVVLQCLTFTRPLTAYLLEDFHSKICPKQEWCFTCELGSIVRNTKEGKSPLSPIGILSHFNNIGSNFGHGQEEDAHEFLRYAIDAMQSVCLKEAGAKPNGILAEETTLVQQIFGGYLKSKIRCGKCKTNSERCERMMDLTVEIDGNISTLDEALLRFTSTEVLDGENKYECGRCKSYERAKKRLKILEAPNVLTIVLKRFQSGKFGKLNKAVQFPEYLNLTRYMSGDDKFPVYGLYAVIVHIDVMNSSSSGHYVCYVKEMQGKWYKINDSEVKPVEFQAVLSEGAYMLLYSRCSPRAPSSVRKAMTRDLVQARRSRRPGGSSFAHVYPPLDNHSNGHLLDLLNGRHRLPPNDSSSDSSSLFDEGSSSISTESTKDSTSTEDYWEQDYINLNSPLQDSDGFINSPLSRGHFPRAVSNGSMTDLSRNDGSNPSSTAREVDRLEAEWSSSFLFSDEREHCRHLTGQYISRNVETDCVSPNEVNSGVLFRRTTRERTAQTFY